MRMKAELPVAVERGQGSHETGNFDGTMGLSGQPLYTGKAVSWLYCMHGSITGSVQPGWVWEEEKTQIVSATLGFILALC